MGFFDFLSKIFGGGASVGADYYNKLLRLPVEETITFGTGGKYLQGTGTTVTARAPRSPGQRRGYRGPTSAASIGGNYMLAITDRNRMAIGDMQTMDPSLARHFEPGSISVDDGGYLGQKGGALSGHDSYTLAGPTGEMEKVRVLHFKPQQGESFRLIAVDSVVPRILEWAQQQPDR